MNRQSVSVFDLAAYLLREYNAKSGQKGLMTAMKLQKLVYYCQAWSLAWNRRPLFGEKIEAWIHGPVVPELFAPLKGKYHVRHLPKSLSPSGNPDNLRKNQVNTADTILEFYGPMSPEALTGLTHQEWPWRHAREEARLEPNERGNQEIPHTDMQRYYSELASQTCR